MALFKTFSQDQKTEVELEGHTFRALTADQFLLWCMLEWTSNGTISVLQISALRYALLHSLIPRRLKNRRGAPGIHCLRMCVKIRYIFRIIYRDM